MTTLGDPPIPPGIWQRLLAFLAAKKTGQFALNVSDGRVESCDVREHYREGRQVP